MKIDILVDSSGSTDFNRVDEFLYILRDEFFQDEVTVSFVSSGVKVDKKLCELDIPLDKNTLMELGGGGSASYPALFESSVKNGANHIILIGDMFDEPLKRECVEAYPNNNFYFFLIPGFNGDIDLDVLNTYIGNIKDLPNVFSTVLSSYISLDKMQSFNKDYTDKEKLKTFFTLNDLILSLSNTKDADKINDIAIKIDTLLKGYSEDEIKQFAQCITGERNTLPNSDSVILIERKKFKI